MSNIQEFKRLYYEEQFKNGKNTAIGVFKNNYEPQSQHVETSLQIDSTPKTIEEITRDLLNNPGSNKPFFKGYEPDFYFRCKS